MTIDEAIKDLIFFEDKLHNGIFGYKIGCFDVAIKALKEIQQYRAIGTIEECREARERQRAKKPELYGDFEDGKLLCPNCEEDLMDLAECGFNCCPYCGQNLDWSELDWPE